MHQPGYGWPPGLYQQPPGAFPTTAPGQGGAPAPPQYAPYHFAHPIPPFSQAGGEDLPDEMRKPSFEKDELIASVLACRGNTSHEKILERLQGVRIPMRTMQAPAKLMLGSRNDCASMVQVLSRTRR